MTYPFVPSDGCIAPPDAPPDYCLDADAVGRCDGGETTTEVVVDADGNVLDVVCIPPGVEAVQALDLADGEVDQTSNSTALIFTDDGGRFDGDLTVDGNNVVLYGHDPEDAVIDGTLTLEGNNGIVRGVSITGDLLISKNNPIVVFCVVQGDVTIESNNSKLSGCDIWGDVTIMGNNTELHGNRIGGTLTDRGQNTGCTGNSAFLDENADGTIADAETLGPITCGSHQQP